VGTSGAPSLRCPICSEALALAEDPCKEAAVTPKNRGMGTALAASSGCLCKAGVPAPAEDPKEETMLNSPNCGGDIDAPHSNGMGTSDGEGS